MDILTKLFQKYQGHGRQNWLRNCPRLKRTKRKWQLNATWDLGLTSGPEKEVTGTTDKSGVRSGTSILAMLTCLFGLSVDISLLLLLSYITISHSRHFYKCGVSLEYNIGIFHLGPVFCSCRKNPESPTWWCRGLCNQNGSGERPLL